MLDEAHSSLSAPSSDVSDLLNVTWDKVWVPLVAAVKKVKADIAKDADAFYFPDALPANNLGESQARDTRRHRVRVVIPPH